MVSLGCGLQGAACPHPDPGDSDTMLCGVKKRFASLPPEADATLILELRDFVSKWLSSNVAPISPETDLSVETWLERTRYTAGRKKELLDIYRDSPKLLPKHRELKGFMKDETYPAYKHARGINSRSDRFKCEVGPFAKACEDILYEHTPFIKHVPVAERPRVIHEALSRLGGLYGATDYTAFESLFIRTLMDVCEFELYRHMSSLNMEAHRQAEELMAATGGINVIHYKHFTVLLPATRMSGEMVTSLGNGFSNLMFLYFVASKSNCNVTAFVEGDDAIFSCDGVLQDHLFTKLGLNIKLEWHSSLNEASFCGIIYDEMDLAPVTNPLEVLATFGYTTNTYLNANQNTKLMLLRSKALSYAYQYPGCPIISSLARYGLRMTRGRDIRNFVQNKLKTNQWEREQMLDALHYNPIDVPVGMGTRLLVEKLYGITVESQIKFEDYLDSLEVLCPLEWPIIDLLVPPSWVHYFVQYSEPVKSSSKPTPCR
jgi:hypothetical protein